MFRDVVERSKVAFWYRAILIEICALISMGVHWVVTLDKTGSGGAHLDLVRREALVGYGLRSHNTL